MIPRARSFLFAWHFLTLLPLSRTHHEPTAADLPDSMAWYPLVGLAIGALLAATDLLLSTLFQPSVVAALVITLLVILTRGLHQDGLADTVDGLVGGRAPAARLAIMRDPCIGALGATGLSLSLLLRFAGLLALPSQARWTALLCLPAISRWAMVATAVGMPYARAEGGLAAGFLAGLSRRHLMVATGWVVMIECLGIGAVNAVIGLAAAGALVLLLRRAWRLWFGGVTGDLLGATNELVEIALLLAVPLWMGAP